MKINSHIIQLDNMATVAILTLGEMVERVMIDRTAFSPVLTLTWFTKGWQIDVMELLQGPCSIAVNLWEQREAILQKMSTRLQRLATRQQEWRRVFEGWNHYEQASNTTRLLQDDHSAIHFYCTESASLLSCSCWSSACCCVLLWSCIEAYAIDLIITPIHRTSPRARPFT